MRDVEALLGREWLEKWFQPRSLPDALRHADDWVLEMLAFDIWSTLAVTGEPVPRGHNHYEDFRNQPETVRALCLRIAHHCTAFLATFEECKELNGTPAPLFYRPPEHPTLKAVNG